MPGSWRNRSAGAPRANKKNKRRQPDRTVGLASFIMSGRAPSGRQDACRCLLWNGAGLYVSYAAFCGGVPPSGLDEIETGVYNYMTQDIPDRDPGMERRSERDG